MEREQGGHQGTAKFYEIRWVSNTINYNNQSVNTVPRAETTCHLLNPWTRPIFWQSNLLSLSFLLVAKISMKSYNTVYENYSSYFILSVWTMKLIHHTITAGRLFDILIVWYQTDMYPKGIDITWLLFHPSFPLSFFLIPHFDLFKH